MLGFHSTHASKHSPHSMIAVVHSLVALIVGLHCSKVVHAQLTAQSYYSPGGNNRTCLHDGDCNGGRFCSHPPLNDRTGTCLQCWRCCLFPSIHGACPDSCGCNIDQACAHPEDCGQGLFCSISSSLGIPTCQACTDCSSDSLALAGTCSFSCPSGVVNSAGAASQAYIYLSFSAAEISADATSMSMLPVNDIQSWLVNAGLSAVRTQVTMENLNPGDKDPLPVAELINTLMTHSSLAVLCPNIPTDASTKPADVVLPGCPCNATNAAATFACPGGFRCSRSAYLGLSIDAVQQQTAAQLQAICMACEPGQFCPMGTYVQDESDLTVLDCAAGYYCPTPAQQLPCPPGSYCIDRTIQPLTCDYQQMLNTNPYADVPLMSQNVVQRLRNDQDPMRGNFCPAYATKPNALCKGGYYCPNTTVQLVCPQGHFCKEQSIRPQPCSSLTHCPEGTNTPKFSALAFLVAGLVVAALPAIWCLVYLLDNSSTSYETIEMHQQKRVRALHITRQLLNSFKQSTPATDVQAKYHGFGTVEPRIHLEFENLGMQLRHSKQVVLEGVSGYFAPTRLNAVMGPSGSGKTTFLNVLCGKVGSNIITGQVRINGEALPLSKLQKRMGFVPQDDTVHEDLTVRENLAYAAHLKLPRDSKGKQAAVIEDALEILQLKHIQNYQVGSVEKRGISGGQRKRVNIGIELVAHPSLLFLDEPTSGLDSTSSSDILKSLADMAMLGMTVVAVIHQPRFSSFMLFDQVLMLGEGGRTVYMGQPGVALLYFQTGLSFPIPARENPADILMDIIGGKVPRKGDPRFKPSMLAEWWAKNGQQWVEEFEKKNPLIRREDLIFDPEMMAHIDEEFDGVDRDATGCITAAQVIELFEGLGHPISVDDALLLIKNILKGSPGGSRPDSAASSSSKMQQQQQQQQQQAAPEPTITKEQLMDALQRTFDKKQREANMDPLDRFQTDDQTSARYLWPNINISTHGTDADSLCMEQLERLGSDKVQGFASSANSVTRAAHSYLSDRARVYLEDPSTEASVPVVPGRIVTASDPGHSLGSSGRPPRGKPSFVAPHKIPDVGSPKQPLPALPQLSAGKHAVGLDGTIFVNPLLAAPGFAGPAGAAAAATALANAASVSLEQRQPLGEGREMGIGPVITAMNADIMQALRSAPVPMPMLPRAVPAANAPTQSTTAYSGQLAAFMTYDSSRLHLSEAAAAAAYADLTQHVDKVALAVAARASTRCSPRSGVPPLVHEGPHSSLASGTVASLDSLPCNSQWASECVQAAPPGAHHQEDNQGPASALPRGPVSPVLSPASLRGRASIHNALAVAQNTKLLHNALSPRNSASHQAAMAGAGAAAATDAASAPGLPSLLSAPVPCWQDASERARISHTRTATSVQELFATHSVHINPLYPHDDNEHAPNTSHGQLASPPSVAQHATDHSTTIIAAAAAGGQAQHHSSVAIPQSVTPGAAGAVAEGVETGHPETALLPLLHHEVSQMYNYGGQSESGVSSIYPSPSREVARMPQDSAYAPEASEVSQFHFRQGLSVNGAGEQSAMFSEAGDIPNASEPSSAIAPPHPIYSATVPNPRMGRGISTRARLSHLSAAVKSAVGIKFGTAHGSGTHASSATSVAHHAHSSPGRTRHTSRRDTTWVDSMLAGIIHQSITVRRAQEFGFVSRMGSSISVASSKASRAITAASMVAKSRIGSIIPVSKSRALVLNQERRNMLLAELASRHHPGFFVQLWLLLQRKALQYMRSFWPLKVVDVLLLLAAAFIIGFIHGTNWGLSSVASNAVMAMTCLGVLSMVTHLRTFTQHQVLLWRESSSGISTESIFMSANIVDVVWILLAPALYLGPYYYLTLPLQPFGQYYLAALMVCWWTSGMAYIVSVILPPQTVLKGGVFVALIFGAFLQGLTPTIATARGTALEVLLGVSYNRWAMEIIAINEFRHYQDNMRNVLVMIAKGVGICGVDQLLYVDSSNDSDTLTPKEAISFIQVQQNFTMSDCDRYSNNGYIVLLFLGVGFRLLAYLVLRLRHIYQKG